MHKVAIVRQHGYVNYDHSRIAATITDWEEVSDEDFKLLKQVQASSYGDKAFMLLEMQKEPKEFIANSVSTMLKKVKAEQAKQAAAEAKRKAEEEKRAEAARIKKAAADKKKLEKMLADQGLMAVPKVAPNFDLLPDASGQ